MFMSEQAERCTVSYTGEDGYLQEDLLVIAPWSLASSLMGD